MRFNYKAWEVKLDDFYLIDSSEDKLKFIINFAVLAPSSHNSQPWRFLIRESVIEIYLEPKRLLHIGDENNRQAVISLGCAAENIMIAADYFGYKTTKKISETLDCSVPVISIKLETGGISHRDETSHPVHQIIRRTVNRSNYLKPISENLMIGIKKIFNSSVDIDIISDKDKIIKLADIALDATAESMSNKSFRAELSNFVISNTSSKRYGMPGFTIGFPTPISYLAPFVLKMLNLSKITRKQDEPLLKEYTPHIGIISTKDDNHLNWVHTGILFERLCLMLTEQEISVAVWAAPIQIGKNFEKISMVLEKNNRPQMFFRIGYPEKNFEHSPRLSSEEVTFK